MAEAARIRARRRRLGPTEEFDDSDGRRSGRLPRSIHADRLHAKPARTPGVFSCEHGHGQPDHFAVHRDSGNEQFCCGSGCGYLGPTRRIASWARRLLLWLIALPVRRFLFAVPGGSRGTGNGNQHSIAGRAHGNRRHLCACRACAGNERLPDRNLSGTGLRPRHRWNDRGQSALAVGFRAACFGGPRSVAVQLPMAQGNQAGRFGSGQIQSPDVSRSAGKSFGTLNCVGRVQPVLRLLCLPRIPAGTPGLPV